MNNATWITILGFYTLLILFGIYYYEEKITKLNRELDAVDSDYDEVFQAYVRTSEQADSYQSAYESEHSAIHYQMEINEILDVDNQALKAQIKALKLENSELRSTAGDWQRAYELSKPIQYESSGWAGMPEVSNTTYTIDTNPYKADIEYIQDHLDFEQ